MIDERHVIKSSSDEKIIEEEKLLKDNEQENEDLEILDALDN